MGKLNVFEHVTVDGYFVDAKGKIDWAHARADSEWNEWVAGNARGSEGVMLFGRKTYQLMASYWPTPMATQQSPEVAEGMNSREKVVFSRTLKEATWNNTRLVKRGLASEVKKIKATKDVVVMGSGTIVAQLADAGLVDQYQLVVNPLALGKGRTLFEGMKKPLSLKLVDERRFKNGNVVLTYVTGK
jgi:dihydrofolate reductase